MAYLLIFITGLWFFSCDQLSGTTNETESGISIALTGKVVNGNGEPLAGIIVKLAKLGFTDTTASDGVYLVEGTLFNEKINTNVQNTVPFDTLHFYQLNQKVSSLAVFKPQDKLNNIIIEQRNFYGKLRGNPSNIKNVEAILYGGNIPENDPLLVSMQYNRQLNQFSRFIYFPLTPNTEYYHVVVKVIDNQGRLVGESQVIDFLSIEGDINFGTIDPFNALPIANAGNDTTVSINDIFTLYGKGVDSNGSIVTYRWIVEDSLIVDSDNNGAITLRAPAKPEDSIQCIFEIFDNSGNRADDTMFVGVVKDVPELSLIGSSIVMGMTEVTFVVSVKQKFGSIKQIFWDDGIKPGVDDSGKTHFHTIFNVDVTSPTTVKVTVIDDDDNLVSLSKDILVLAEDSVINIENGYDSLSGKNVPLAKERIIVYRSGKKAWIRSKLKKALEFKFYYGFHHQNGIASISENLHQIDELDTNIQIHSIAQDKEWPKSVGAYQVMIANNNTQLAAPAKPEEQETRLAMRKDMENFVENGGGIFVIHGTGDTKNVEWKWYEKHLMPVRYVGHGKIGSVNEVAMNQIAKNHLILEGIDTIAKVIDEFHNFNDRISNKKPDTEILFTINDEYPDYRCYCSDKNPDPAHPIMWSYKVGKGRVVYTSLGHDNSIDKTWGENWDKFLAQSMYWLAGYDTVIVK